MAVIYSAGFAIDLVAGDKPLTHARIGYQNFVNSGSVTASSETVNFEADSVQSQMTYSKWRPSAMPANIVIDFGSSKTVNYVGIAAHNLSTKGSTIIIQRSTDGVSYTTIIASHTPADDGAILALFEESTVRYIKIFVTGASSPDIGVIYSGLSLDMYRPFYGGHTPGKLSRETTIKPNKSVGGQWLGRSVIRQGLSAQYGWKNTPIGWYETNVDPFSKSAIENPFFIAWNPDQFPDHVLYAWTSEDIKPSLSGIRDLCEFGFSVEAVE